MRGDVDRNVRRSPRGSRSSAPLALGVILLFVIAMLATALSGPPRIDLSPEPVASVPLPEVEATPVITIGPPPAEQDTGTDVALLIVGIVLTLIVMALIILMLIWLIRRLIEAWRNRPLRARDGAEVDVDITGEALPGEAEPDVPAVRRGITAARTLIEHHVDPGDAIVAAWVGLEETASDSGVGRGRSETPAEFTLRILLRRAGMEDSAQQLLDLYEQVRFGGHVASELDRERAVHALARIEEGWR